MNFGFMGGCVIGPMISSTIRTISGSYAVAWFVYIAIFAVMALFSAMALQAGNKLRETMSTNKDS